MSVFKIKKQKNYTVMSNYHLQDKKLSYKAKGLLSFMLSLPEDWDYSISGLVKILKELQDNHYIEIEKIRGSKGYFEYNYLIYEIPKSNPDMPNPYLDKLDMDMPTQINTNIINTKEIDKSKMPSSISQKHNPLTIKLINKKYIDSNDKEIKYYNNLFNELLNNNSYEDLSQIVDYIVNRVISRGFKDENCKYIFNKFNYFKNSMISNIEKLNTSIEDLWDTL